MKKYKKDSVAVCLICKMQPKTSGAGTTNLVTNFLTGGVTKFLVPPTNVFGCILQIQSNFNGSNTDGSFTTAVWNSFLSP